MNDLLPPEIDKKKFVSIGTQMGLNCDSSGIEEIEK
jgi:hypothetical protein